MYLHRLFLLLLPPHFISSSFAEAQSASKGPPGDLKVCPEAELIFVRGTKEAPGLGRVGTELYKGLIEMIPSLTAYGVFYDAPMYKGSYVSGQDIQAGTEDIKRRMDQWVGEGAYCNETKIILGGFSLGAAVLRDLKLTEEIQSRVEAVLIFGYPFLLWTDTPYPIPAERVWTKCIDYDPVCSAWSIWNGGTFDAHKEYHRYMVQAVDFVRRVGSFC